MFYENQERIDLLKQFEALKYGMFIHYGMSTFVNQELPSGDEASELYAPSNLDVEQWVRVAHDAGMKYAVLTTKHVSGHCLWPSKYTDYSVATSSDNTDVVRSFVDACEKYGLWPGFYYCCWDNHHRFGSVLPGVGSGTWNTKYSSMEYIQFQEQQIRELLSDYKGVRILWMDIPGMIPRAIREVWHKALTSENPGLVFMSNNGIGDGSSFDINYSWPSDYMPIERYLPNSNKGYNKDFTIEGKHYYVPGEVCDPIGYEWFYTEGDKPRSDMELLGMALICRERGVNLLLDVPPDRTGQIPQIYINSLMRLKDNLKKLGY